MTCVGQGEDLGEGTKSDLTHHNNPQKMPLACFHGLWTLMPTATVYVLKVAVLPSNELTAADGHRWSSAAASAVNSKFSLAAISSDNPELKVLIVNTGTSFALRIYILGSQKERGKGCGNSASKIKQKLCAT